MSKGERNVRMCLKIPEEVYNPVYNTALKNIPEDATDEELHKKEEEIIVWLLKDAVHRSVSYGLMNP